MKVFVDNRESGPLTQRQWKEARKLLARHPASGRVMNPDEARRANLRRGMVVGTILLVCCWILAVIFAILGSSDGAIAQVIAGVILWLAICLGFWLSFPIRRAGLVERYRGLPEPGVDSELGHSGSRIRTPQI